MQLRGHQQRALQAHGGGKASGLTCVRAGRRLVPALVLAVCGLPMAAVAGDETTRYSLTQSFELGGGPSASLGDVTPLAGADDTHGSTRDPRYSLTLDADAVSRPVDDVTGLGDRVEAAGGFRHRLGSSGLGYGVDLGFGMESRHEPGSMREDGASASYFTDFSFGPTFESGGFDSQLRIGMRQPLAGASRDDAAGIGPQPRDRTRGASYLSLDGSLRLGNDSELSMSLFYDDYSLDSTDGWMEDRLEFEGMRPESGGSGSSSVFGVEMGLTF